jgi:hypothetical protein
MGINNEQFGVISSADAVVNSCVIDSAMLFHVGHCRLTSVCGQSSAASFSIGSGSRPPPHSVLEPSCSDPSSVLLASISTTGACSLEGILFKALGRPYSTPANMSSSTHTAADTVSHSLSLSRTLSPMQLVQPLKLLPFLSEELWVPNGSFGRSLVLLLSC